MPTSPCHRRAHGCAPPDHDPAKPIRMLFVDLLLKAAKEGSGCPLNFPVPALEEDRSGPTMGRARFAA